MVMPRSRSISMESSTCSFISRCVSPPVSWISRSAKVDLPWSIWATMEKLRICVRSVIGDDIAAGLIKVQCALTRRAGGELERAACRLHADKADRGYDHAHAPDIPAGTNADLEIEIGREHPKHRHVKCDPKADGFDNKGERANHEPRRRNDPKRELVVVARDGPMHHAIQHQPDEDAA